MANACDERLVPPGSRATPNVGHMRVIMNRTEAIATETQKLAPKSTTAYRLQSDTAAKRASPEHTMNFLSRLEATT